MKFLVFFIVLTTVFAESKDLYRDHYHYRFGNVLYVDILVVKSEKNFNQYSMEKIVAHYLKKDAKKFRKNNTQKISLDDVNRYHKYNIRFQLKKETVLSEGDVLICLWQTVDDDELYNWRCVKKRKTKMLMSAKRMGKISELILILSHPFFRSHTGGICTIKLWLVRKANRITSFYYVKN